MSQRLRALVSDLSRNVVSMTMPEVRNDALSKLERLARSSRPLRCLFYPIRLGAVERVGSFHGPRRPKSPLKPTTVCDHGIPAASTRAVEVPSHNIFRVLRKIEIRPLRSRWFE